MNTDKLRLYLTKHVGRTYVKESENYNTICTDVLAYHPVWSLRLTDIKSLRIRRSRLNKAIQLQLKTNRIWFTISWISCQPGKPTQPVSSQTQLISAMRQSIQVQITQWKRSTLCTKQCCTCQSAHNLQVDHKDMPFSQIQRMFLETILVAPQEFGINASSCICKFLPKDSSFKHHWQEFHKTHATYQYLCKTCNQKKGCK